MAAIVIDIGTDTCKAGLAGDDDPKVICPSLVGYSQHEGSTAQKYYIGHEAEGIDNLSLNYPINNGMIADWDNMEKILHHIYHKELQISPEERTALIADVPLNPKTNREKMSQLLFETFNCPSMNMVNQAALSLYAAGHTDGTVLLSGEGASYAVPVCKGYAIQDSILKLDFAGSHLTNYMIKLLAERSDIEMHPKIIRDIKEKLTYVASDFEQEMQDAAENSKIERTYEMPDGKQITIANERFRCAEAMFQPDVLLGVKSPGIHQVTYNAIVKCNDNCQQTLFNCVVMAGGNTMFPGIDERMTKEMTALVSSDTKVKVIAHPKRLHTPWIGGSILASLQTPQMTWISKKEYDENGADIVNKKCF